MKDKIYEAAVLSRNQEIWENYKQRRNNIVQKIKEAKNNDFIEMIDIIYN